LPYSASIVLELNENEQIQFNLNESIIDPDHTQDQLTIRLESLTPPGEGIVEFFNGAVYQMVSMYPTVLPMGLASLRYTPPADTSGRYVADVRCAVLCAGMGSYLCFLSFLAVCAVLVTRAWGWLPLASTLLALLCFAVTVTVLAVTAVFSYLLLLLLLLGFRHLTLRLPRHLSPV
jgi:hypothetical protein